MDKMTIRDIDVKGKRVLLRVDFNVPVDKKTGEITDDQRIVEALPTIKHLSDKGARTIIMAHFGRPKGVDENLRLDKVAKRLEEKLGKSVKKLNDSIGEEVEKEVFNMKDSDVYLLENIRFYPEETKNDDEFTKKLSKLGEIYVNDAFGTAHRAHSSTAGLAKYLPAYSGFLIEKELKHMGKALVNPDRPFAAIIGGAKISTKIDVVENLLKVVDFMVIGGAMANTFLKAMGKKVGKSLVEDDKLDVALNIINKAKELNKKLVLPCDVVVSKSIEDLSSIKTVSVDEIPDDMSALDIGSKSIEEIVSILKTAKTVLWNGPVGLFEVKEFANGTIEIAKTLASIDAETIVGGGDSAAAIKEFGFEDKITHVSTGGGASLEFFEGKVLPGIDCLKNK
jgi:3-phosphoglycerate kinase